MTKIKKIVVRACLIFTILVPVAAFAHFIIFPQETRSILIGCSNFKKNGRVYFSSTTAESKIDSLISLIEKASIRIDNFWGHRISNPRIIYCEKADDFINYSVKPFAPAVTYLKLGSVVVLSADGLDLDIIAHEFSHAEFYERIGFWKFNYQIPSWFKHGLAMQNDYRNYYSDDTLRAKSGDFKNLPDIKTFKSDRQFYAGSREQIMLNYMTAKHEIKKWYTKERLNRFINQLNSGKPFERAFEQSQK